MNKQGLLFLFILFMLAAIFFYWFSWKTMILTPDSLSYIQNAKDIAEFRWPSNPERVPLISLLFALTGPVTTNSNSSLLLLVHLFMHAFAIGSIAFILYDIGFKKEVIFGLSAILWLPVYVDHAVYVLTETSSEFLLAMVFVCSYLYFKKQKKIFLWLAAVFSASVVLVRPIFWLLSPLMTAILILAKGKISQANSKLKNILQIGLVFFLPFFILVIGWASFNYSRFGFFGLTSNYGFHFSSRVIKVFERLPDSEAEVRDTLIKYRDIALIAPHSSHTGYLAAFDAVPELEKITGKNRIELSRKIFGLSWWLVKEAPLNYLSEVATSFANYWLPVFSRFLFGGERKIQFIWSLFCLGINILFFNIPLLIVFKLGKPPTQGQYLKNIFLTRVMLLVALAIIIYNCLISCAFDFGYARHRRPTDFLILFSITLVLFSKSGVWRSADPTGGRH